MANMVSLIVNEIMFVVSSKLHLMSMFRQEIHKIVMKVKFSDYNRAQHSQLSTGQVLSEVYLSSDIVVVSCA